MSLQRGFSSPGSPARPGIVRPHQHQQALHAFGALLSSAMLYSRLPRSSQLPNEHLRAAVLASIAVRLQQRPVLVLTSYLSRS